MPMPMLRLTSAWAVAALSARARLKQTVRRQACAARRSSMTNLPNRAPLRASCVLPAEVHAVAHRRDLNERYWKKVAVVVTNNRRGRAVRQTRKLQNLDAQGADYGGTT